jgi:hypothetical protein
MPSSVWNASIEQAPTVYSGVIHFLLGALLEAEAELHGLRAENAALWRALADDTKRSQ